MGLTGSGKLWLADPGGMLLQYSLDRAGDGVMQTYRYSLTQINALGDVVLPVGCEPVLDTIPVMDGATSLQRLPGAEDYATAATVVDVSAFYQPTLPASAGRWSATTQQTRRGRRRSSPTNNRCRSPRSRSNRARALRG